MTGAIKGGKKKVIAIRSFYLESRRRDGKHRGKVKNGSIEEAQKDWEGVQKGTKGAHVKGQAKTTLKAEKKKSSKKF